MQPTTIILLESTLSLGVPLAVAVRELWLLRQTPPDDGRAPLIVMLPIPPDLGVAPQPERRVLEDA